MRLFLVLVFSACIFSSCEKALDLKSSSKSNSVNFEELWKVLDERYALFAVKNIDWNKVHQEFLPQVSDNMNEHEFFLLVSHMLDSLKDGHVTLTSKEDHYTYNGFYELYPTNFNYNNLLNNYLKSDYGSSGPLLYKATDGVGYIYCSSFAEEITNNEIEIVLAAMNDTKGLIIDMRNNTGGKTLNADRLFAHFINSERLVKYEELKKGTEHNEFYDPVSYSVAPLVPFYNKPVVVLTNRKCFSACNDFVSYMSQLENVKIFGDQTGGGGSIPHSYILSNGWTIQYSSSITLTPNKVPIENGIIPDRFLTITPIQESQGRDIIIEEAFDYLH